MVVGRAIEKEIIEFLRSKGLVITPATVGEDMHDKVDAWIIWNGKREAVQIKFREGGNDVIFEILRDFDKMLPGRDMVSKASIYIIMDTHHTIRMFRVEDLKAKAQALQDYVYQDLEHFPRKTAWGKPNHCSVKITIDRASQQRKLMAYFNPAMLNVLGTWQK